MTYLAICHIFQVGLGKNAELKQERTSLSTGTPLISRPLSTAKGTFLPRKYTESHRSVCDRWLCSQVSSMPWPPKISNSLAPNGTTLMISASAIRRSGHFSARRVPHLIACKSANQRDIWIHTVPRVVGLVALLVDLVIPSFNSSLDVANLISSIMLAHPGLIAHWWRCQVSAS